ncbi:MAG TPA: metalloregulator ArsR/SmtB family transcription factor [Candidatus Brocadiia bacterium]|nr:metalloregulator ArsR/SmtB family transcription factor [Candidatus Brocadiia bacterium]
MMKALSVEARARIVQLLKERELCVNALAMRLGVTQGAVSQHLRVLRDAGLVDGAKRGYFVHYRLNEKALAAWRQRIGELLAPSSVGGADKKGGETGCARAVKRSRAARSPKR